MSYEMELKCYQTCKIESEQWSTLFERFPHFAVNSADSKNIQWLSEGYYFWTDSCRNAHWWGSKRLKEPYCITEYFININSESLLDLSGNTEHMEYLYKLKDFFIDNYNKIYTNAEAPKPTISVLVEYFRKFYKDEMFGFSAIKIHHNFYDNGFEPIYMTANSKEFFNGIPRIQLCVFNESVSCIKDKFPIYPNEYCEYICS